MNIYKELRKLAVKMDADVSNAHQIKDLIRAMSVKLDGNSNGAAIADAVKNLTDVHSTESNLHGLTVDIPYPVDEVLGKLVGEVQDGVRVDGNLICGTSYFTEGYTAFSEQNPELQRGNFLIVHASVPGVDDVTIKVHVTNSQIIADGTLDPDGLFVFRITDPKKQKITFTASKEGFSDFSRTYSLTNVICQKTPTAGFKIVGFEEGSTYSIWNKQVKDLESAITVTEETTSTLATACGTLKYVEDFSPFQPPYDEGYFLAARVITGALHDSDVFDPSSISVKIGFEPDTNIPLTSIDTGVYLINGLRITDTSKKLYVTVSCEDHEPTTKTFSLEGLILQGQE